MSDPTVEELRARAGVMLENYRKRATCDRAGGPSTEWMVGFEAAKDVVSNLLAKLDDVEKANVLARDAVAEAGESVTKARAEIADASRVFDRLDTATERIHHLEAGIREQSGRLEWAVDREGHTPAAGAMSFDTVEKAYIVAAECNVAGPTRWCVYERTSATPWNALPEQQSTL